MKLLKVIVILLISSFSYYGVVDDNGEKVTNIQEIMQEQKNEIITEQVVEEQIDKIPESIIVEEKQEESKVAEKKEEKNEAKKVENKSNTKKNSKTETTKKVEKQEIKVDKTVENKVVEAKKETTIEEPVKEEIVEKTTEQKEEKVVTNSEKCSSGNHGMGIGNSGKWFATKDEAIATYREEINKWGNKWTKNEITNEEYYKNCPYGYEVWTCPYCNLWTLNYYYE